MRKLVHNLVRNRFLLVGFLAFVCCVSVGAQNSDPPPAPVSEAAPAPESATADPRIASLEAARPRLLDADGKPTDEQALARLDEAISRLRALPQIQEQARAFADEADGAPAQIASLQAELDAPAPAPESFLPPADADLPTLEGAQRLIDEKLAAVRARLDTIGRQRVDRAARADAIPAELAAALARLDDATDRLASLGPPPADGANGASVQRLMAQADLDHARATIDRLEAERRLIKAVAPRRDLRVRLAEREAGTLERARELLSRRVAVARERDAARQQTQARRAAADVPPELEPLSQTALKLGAENASLIERLNAVEADLAATRAQQQQVADRDAQVRARATGAQGSSQIGLLLQRAQESLPNADRLQTEATRLNREAGSLDDRAYELEILLSDLPDSTTAVRKRLRDDLNISDPTEAQVTAAASLFDLQRQAARELQQTIAGPGRLITQVQELAAAKSDLAVRVDLLADFVSARILWVRSDPPVTRVPVRSALGGLAVFFRAEAWRELWSTARARPATLGAAAVLGPLLVAALLYARAGARRRLRAINERVRTAASDRLRYTVGAVFLLAVPAAFLPLLLTAASSFFASLVPPDRPLPTWLGAGLARTALPLFVGAYLVNLCRTNSVGQIHFRWPQASTAHVVRHLRWFVPVIAGITFIIAGARASGGADALALVRFVAPGALLTAAAFFAILLRPNGPLLAPALSGALWHGWRILWPVLYAAIVGAFVTLAVLSLLGWSFTVRTLAGALFQTAIVIALLVLVRSIVLRWLALERRRMALEQYRKTLENLKREREKNAAAEGGAAPEEAMVAPPEPVAEIDLGSIQRQTRQLLNLGLWAAGIALTIPIWQSVFPAVARIDDIRLLPFTATESTSALRESGRYILSLADVLGALVIAVVGVIAVRNIPTMLDGFVLSRTKLDIGARYALTTISRYALVAAVALMFLSSVGFTGRSLGWAIAGLSVGLGLGLQEFVGNFVAGLSLLFERTVRPGDWITVGGVEGIVKSLSIRATVLTDFDRRDVIIPNRSLISETVVNYTRSDATGRAIIKVGVAYGSDTRLVERLLTEAIKLHPLVEDAILTFDTFGDNALNFTARIYLRDITQRLAVINEIHHRVAASFREHKIEISFPQRDLHIRDGQLEVRVTDSRQSGG